MRVSDYELTTLAAGLPPPDGDFDRVLTRMARELLAARKVIEKARASLANAALICDEDIALDAALREYDEVSLSGREPGEPTACHTAEERGIAVATGAGQLPAGNPESTGDSADRRSPAGIPDAPAPDESNRHSTYCACLIERLRAVDNDWETSACYNGLRTEAADEIERLQAEVTRLTAEQDAISVAIGTNEYMDPPDGGNVSLAEQVRRMRDALLARVEAAERDAARYRWLTSDHNDPWVRQHCREILERMGVMSYSATSTAIDTALEIEQFHAIDAAMEGGK